MKDSVKFVCVKPSGKEWHLTGYKGGSAPIDKLAELVLSSTFHPVMRIAVGYNRAFAENTVSEYVLTSVLRNNIAYSPDDWHEVCTARRDGTHSLKVAEAVAAFGQ